MSLSFLAIGYQHINRGGLARLFGVGNSARYNHINEDLLGQLSFDAILSSIQVNASSSAIANVILFSNYIGGFANIGSFAGDFKQIGVAKNGGPAFANATDF